MIVEYWIESRNKFTHSGQVIFNKMPEFTDRRTVISVNWISAHRKQILVVVVPQNSQRLNKRTKVLKLLNPTLD